MRLVCLGMVVALAAGAARAEDPAPKLDWGACPPGSEAFDCASMDVPMDYSRPEAGAFHLALIRHRAEDPAARIGTLFWNPGGPSDAGTQYLPASIQGFPPRVRARFDIVSWDPRGMGGRTRPVVACFDTAAEEGAALEQAGQGDLPVTEAELAAYAKGRAAFNAACVARNGELLRHVSTADNARDLDLLRRALGDARLTYYGTSYGTFLGATYANMFPDRLRAAVLDGAVDPAAWAGNAGADPALSTFLRIGSDFGAMETARAFMDQCGAVGPESCAFSAGTPEATRKKWSDLLVRGKAGIRFGDATLDDRAIATYLASSIYLVDPLPGFGRFPGWMAVAAFLEDVWAASKGKAPAPSDDGGDPAPEAPGEFVTSSGRQLAVICGESPNPATAEAVTAQALASYARAGLSPWPFVASCIGWTARAADPWTGPWNKATAPILVIGNTFDPATPLPSSQRMAQELANARLLTVNGFGHTVLLNPSRCAQDHIAAYLIDGTLPPSGAECDQDKAPFPGD